MHRCEIVKFLRLCTDIEALCTGVLGKVGIFGRFAGEAFSCNGADDGLANGAAEDSAAAFTTIGAVDGTAIEVLMV